MGRTSERDRRSAVWEVCDRLAEQHIKPTRQIVAAHYPHGSAGDVQRDINDWYAQVFTRHTHIKRIPGIPDEVVKFWQDAWEQSFVRASSAFDLERQDFDQERKGFEGAMATKTQELAQALRDSEQYAAALEAERAVVEQMRRELADVTSARAEEARRADRAEAQLSERTVERDAIREKLSDAERRHEQELVSLREDHRIHLHEMREDHDRSVSSLLRSQEELVGALKAQIEHLQIAHAEGMTRFDEQFKRLQVDSLLQLDKARTELREERDAQAQGLIDRERKIAALEAQTRALTDQLAAERERAQALQAVSQEQIARLTEAIRQSPPSAAAS